MADIIALKQEDLEDYLSYKNMIEYFSAEYERHRLEAQRCEVLVQQLQEGLTLRIAHQYGTDLNEQWQLDIQSKQLVKVTPINTNDL